MKLKRLNMIVLASAALAVCGCKTNDDLNEHHFDNKVFVDMTEPISNFVFKNTESSSASQDLYLATALEAETAVTGRFVAAPSKVSDYNEMYGEEAHALPDDKCVIESPVATIDAGGTKSNPVTVSFVNLETLNRDSVYVMPVEVTDVTGTALLASKKTAYFVFEGASLINVVADIAENYFPVNWKTPDLVSDMSTITVEALIRVRDFGNVGGKKGENMSSIFGIEGEFLIRIGDSGFPENQVQLVTPNGNFPEGNSSLGLPTNEWVHVAVVWDATTGDRIIYTNGEEIAHDQKASGTIDISETGEDGCYIGRAYNDERWLEGEIAELRIWNVQRTPEEIASHFYEVDPASEGLVTYWKFDDGTGKVVKDHTANGNDVTANGDLVWTPVALPESGK